MKKLGFIVNPIAGMGGRVGLKGTDGDEILELAIRLGAKPIAPERAKEMLFELKKLGFDLELITYPRVMGEFEARECGFNPVVIGEIGERTSRDDTIRAARDMVELGVDLIVFCGGDGTARDVCEAIDKRVPVLGVPTGVKMHSAVFAVNPRVAARIVVDFLKGFLPLRDGEVMDVDEEAFRRGFVSAKLYGYLLVPYEPNFIQGAKAPSPQTDDERENQLAIARYFVERMDDDTIYILGPGSTIKAVADVLNIPKTLLGVDIVYRGKLLASDVNEKKLLDIIKRFDGRCVIVVTPIGNQGFIFGRGNQQISPEVIKSIGRDNIVVLATRYKLSTIPCLRVDTGDVEVDDLLKGYMRVIVDYGEEKIVRVA
ncbi:MAG: ATP-NAD kinase family protein [archaeon GB-1867-035]|nr:ATP-NAD kinase family protein [Candidatus Culexmicrobium profundum]